LTLVLAVEPRVFDAYAARAPESRAKASLRETVIPIPSLGPEDIRRRLVQALPGATADLDRPIARLAADGVSRELAQLYEDAAVALAALPSQPADPARESRARSAAERFLFERLESLPETAGVFRLNATLGFRFGPTRDIEVDLAAVSLGLAVEIDGYYHFQDPEAYRRDRRKDLELQKHGYLVVRVLAGDVVQRLEEVLDSILAAVAFRRAELTGTGERGEQA
jgi:very-short-patch-repair endonuclease